MAALRRDLNSYQIFATNFMLKEITNLAKRTLQPLTRRIHPTRRCAGVRGQQARVSRLAGRPAAFGAWPPMRFQVAISKLTLIFLLVISPALLRAQAVLQWSGANSGNWDVGITANWLSGGTAVVFTNGAAAVFGDGASGTTSVNFTTNLQPASIVVSNTANSYTMGGTGYVSGAASFVKLGANLLTLSGSNFFTGSFTISNGTVAVTNLANGGQPSALGASSSTAANLTLAGGTFSYQGLPVQIDRGYAVTGASTLDVEGDLSLSGIVNGTSGTFYKTGPAKLTYTGAGNDQLTGNSANYQLGAGTVVFDGTAGMKVSGAGQFWVGYNTLSGAALILTNTTMTNASWFAVARGNGTAGLTSTATFYNSLMSCGNVSLGYANGISGNKQTGSLTLNGNSALVNTGTTGFNLSESGGSTCAVTLNNNSWIYSLNRVLMGMAAGATGTVTIASSGALTNGGYVSIGANGVGFATLKNNAVWQSPTDFNVTDTAGSQGTLTIQDNAQLTIGTLYVGKSANCTGTVYQSGGSLKNSGGGDWRIGGNVSGAANQLGIYYLSNGVFNTANNFQPGAYGTGYFNQSGGTATIGSYPSVGRYAGGVGYLNVSGGTFNQSSSSANLIIGEQGAGTLNVSGTGLVTCAGNLVIGNAAGGNGTVNLNGGLVRTKQVLMNSSSATSAINFNGGVLQAAPNASAAFLSGLSSATIQSGGAVLDSGTNTITIAQNLLDGGGGLTKLGSGILTLTGSAYYSGNTTVSNGTLMVAAPTTFNSPACTIFSGGNFGVTLTVTNAQLAVPSVSLAASGAGLTFNFANFGGQATAPLLANSLAVNAAAVINIAGRYIAVGQYPLVQYVTRSGSGGFTLGSLPPGLAGQLVTNVPNSSIDLLVTSPSSSPPWSPKQAPLMTEWAQQVNPTNVLAEYPRPQMVRSNWLNLNGVWQFQPGATNDAVPTGQNLSGQILVPFPMESALSGVMQYSAFSWYRLNFTVPTNWNGQRIMLHLDAVNWQSQVYVNGQSVGSHTGGYDPFSFDITPYLTGSGSQELIVRVYSPEDSGGEPRGKQTLYPGGIMYTSSSGIWQPAWLEPVPATSIGSIHLVPDIDNNRLLVNVGIYGPTNGISINAVALQGTNQVGAATGSPGSSFYLPVPSPTLWCPTNPFLYNLQLSLATNTTTVDFVASYFGMRKISIGTNGGFLKMFLNNQFLFEFGPLDQGFWPDGLYTAPTDLAQKSDLEVEKALGFNMVRKHIKVERQRWYYWADKLGLLVWQDMPSCNSYTGSSSPPAVDPLDYIAELTAMVTNHWNSPAIIMWDTFNEGQGEAGSTDGVGQTNTAYLVALVKNVDPSRLVNQASGGNYFGVGDVLDEHSYTPPGVPTSSTQAVVCGEFGGVSLYVTNHTWSATETGEGTASSPADLLSQFDGFCTTLAGFIGNNGLSAAVYTQTTDVETELNGLETYDRKVIKPNLQQMQTAIVSLMGQYSNTPVVPTSQTVPQTWQYTTNTPATNWYAANFNASGWNTGQAGFGNGAPNVTPNTAWTTAGYIYLRRTFNPGALTMQQITNLVFTTYHDEDVAIYINGVLAGSASGYSTAYVQLAITAQGQAAIIPNATNVLAVSCHQTTGGQFIDVGLNLSTLVVPPPAIFVPNWPTNGTGLTANYFNGTNLSNLAFVRTDTNVNFSWSSSAPGPGLSRNHFSVIWTGKIMPLYSEGYTFHLLTSDGCRLWVNGQLLIDKWHDDANSTDVTGSVALTGGQQYNVEIAYYDNTNTASAVLEWDSASQALQVVPEAVLFPAAPPTLASVSNATLTAGQTLTVTNSVTDTNFPGQTFTWNLAASPAGVGLNSTNGLVTWRPAIAQSPSTNLIAVAVTDNGVPFLSATQSFNVAVWQPTMPVFAAPIFTAGIFQFSIGGSSGPDYSIYGTTNLLGSWQLLLTTNPASLPFNFADSTWTNYPQRYYRVLLGP